MNDNEVYKGGEFYASASEEKLTLKAFSEHATNNEAAQREKEAQAEREAKSKRRRRQKVMSDALAMVTAAVVVGEIALSGVSAPAPVVVEKAKNGPCPICSLEDCPLWAYDSHCELNGLYEDTSAQYISGMDFSNDTFKIFNIAELKNGESTEFLDSIGMQDGSVANARSYFQYYNCLKDYEGAQNGHVHDTHYYSEKNTGKDSLYLPQDGLTSSISSYLFFPSRNDRSTYNPGISIELLYAPDGKPAPYKNFTELLEHYSLGEHFQVSDEYRDQMYFKEVAAPGRNDLFLRFYSAFGQEVVEKAAENVEFYIYKDGMNTIEVAGGGTFRQSDVFSINGSADYHEWTGGFTVRIDDARIIFRRVVPAAQYVALEKESDGSTRSVNFYASGSDFVACFEKTKELLREGAERGHTIICEVYDYEDMTFGSTEYYVRGISIGSDNGQIYFIPKDNPSLAFCITGSGSDAEVSASGFNFKGMDSVYQGLSQLTFS